MRQQKHNEFDVFFDVSRSIAEFSAKPVLRLGIESINWAVQSIFFLLYLYQNAFQYFCMGYSSALAWILFLYILVLTLIVQRSSNAWVYYEGEERNG
jgi:ABC-type sugar transport system permease subunit